MDYKILIWHLCDSETLEGFLSIGIQGTGEVCKDLLRLVCRALSSIVSNLGLLGVYEKELYQSASV